jgi:hypothetical protein
MVGIGGSLKECADDWRLRQRRRPFFSKTVRGFRVLVNRARAWI